jgi:hypothetical protein
MPMPAGPCIGPSGAATDPAQSESVNTNPNISNLETATYLAKVEDKNTIAARV